MWKESFPGESEVLKHFGEPKSHDAEWLKQPMEAISLEDIPEWMSGNKFLVTQEMVGRLTDRIVSEYNELFERYCPDGSVAEVACTLSDGSVLPQEEDPEGEVEWKATEEDFFKKVRAISGFKFREHGCVAGMCVHSEGPVDRDRLISLIPEYGRWFITTVTEEGKVRARKREAREIPTVDEVSDTTMDSPEF